MAIHWTRRTTVFAIVVMIALFCIGLLTYEWFGSRSLDQSYNHILQSLKLGMSRTQVQDMLSREGTIYVSAQSYDICHPGDATPSQRELVYVTPNWWYHGNVAFWLCYGDSELLTRFYFADF